MHPLEIGDPTSDAFGDFQWTPEIWKEWTEHTSALARRQLEYQVDLAVRMAKQSNPRSILDAGCGYGRNLVRLRSEFPLGEIVAVDQSSRMLTATKGPGDSLGIHICRATLERLPLVSNCFDLVLCLGVVMHVAKERDALYELARVLRPGGVLLVTFNNALNPFSIPTLAYLRLRKPRNYKQAFHFGCYYTSALANAGLQCETFPGFLIPEIKWPEKFVPLVLKLNGLSSQFGFEPTIRARKPTN